MTDSPSESRRRAHRVIVSQAVLGESIAIENYARMIPVADSTDQRLQLLEDAWNERKHLLTFRRIAEDHGVDVADVREDPYWDRVRVAFRERIDAGDMVGCSLIQDVVLECYAIVLYEALAPVVDEATADKVARIAAEEHEHLGHGIAWLAEAVQVDPALAEAAVEFANERVARPLSEWVRSDDCQPICAVCGAVGGVCAKEDLRGEGLDVEGLQPAFADAYGKALRRAGLPAASVARWLARLVV